MVVLAGIRHNCSYFNAVFHNILLLVPSIKHKLQDISLRTKYLGKAMLVNSVCLHGTQFKLMEHFGMV